ncbi:Ubiquitin-conjugating enzyme E2 O [Operophtera brumata]|uniref:Ubiquitin-conjugating enzyme E2 O n=1 Tax=Operophtera brumata TaxID=104452 RepID=A0A0L7KSB7_OPEBR|nr:Ubiquitin-conjugating enzyme E2 O [Operophtera brumata]
MEGFGLLESAPAGHRFRLSMLQPSEPRTFYAAVKREIKLLKSDLPSGVSSRVHTRAQTDESLHAAALRAADLLRGRQARDEAAEERPALRGEFPRAHARTHRRVSPCCSPPSRGPSTRPSSARSSC